MRSTTKSILTVVSIGLVAASYKYGVESAVAQGNSLVSLGGNTSNSTTAATNPTVDTSGSPTAIPAPSQGGSTSTKPSTSPKAGTGNSSSGSSSGSGSSSATGSGSAGGSSSSGSSSGSTSGSGTTSGSSSGSGSASGSGSGTTTTPASTTVTKTGDVVPYWYGAYQLSVTKTGSTITAVNILQGTFTRSSYGSGTNALLVQSAIASQGSGFGNISRTTYTTKAFKDALDSALAKF